MYFKPKWIQLRRPVPHPKGGRRILNRNRLREWYNCSTKYMLTIDYRSRKGKGKQTANFSPSGSENEPSDGRPPKTGTR